MLRTTPAESEARRLERLRRVLPVLLHVEAHLEDPLGLDQLAWVAGFSPHHFHRVFTEVTGESPAQYVRRLRLERAAYRLKIGTDSVLRIALEAGFTTHETFTRAFSRQFGLTPSQFRAMLRELRDCLGPSMASRTFGGFDDETPLTLRFDLLDAGLEVVRTPERHLLFVRHLGYEGLAERPFLGLWDEVLHHVDTHATPYLPELLVGITHDDPYVTDEARIRFDACVVVAGPVPSSHPVHYRYLPPGLCVTRRHTGGLEEVARTFAYIGVNWLPSAGYGLSADPPFETYHCARTADGGPRHLYTDAFVPLALHTEQGHRTEQEEAP